MTTKTTTRSEGLVQALKKSGARQRAADALVIGNAPDLGEAVMRLLKPARLVARHGDDAFALDEETGPFPLVVIGDGLERTSLAGVRRRMQAIARITTDDGHIGLWVSTLAAPDVGVEDEGVKDYQALLFPFPAASGDLGPSVLATTPLSASSWMLMARACGLEIVSCEGFGQQPLPDDVAEHTGRLSVYDSRELASGKLLMILRKMEGSR